ncbi:MAG: thrombospondin type 3 repeat-containing protein [Gammaproteobacteria bacterium]
MKNITWLFAAVIGLSLTSPAYSAETKAFELAPIVQDIAVPMNSREKAAACAMLDDPKKRVRMDGLLYKLLIMCGRQSELGTVKSAKFKAQAGKAPGTDTLVNDPTGEFSATKTQNETSIARNEVTGTLCSGFNDSFSGVTTTGGFTGFARSTDDGVTFTDQGALSDNSNGDPSIVWRRIDQNFYFATLHTNGIGVWRSTDDCSTFDFIGLSSSSGGDDKEILVVDNNPASPFYGRMHVSWIDFGAGAQIFNTFSADSGATWSAPLAVSAPGSPVQGAWPGIAADGTVYVSWGRFNGNTVSVDVSRSTDGGVSFTQVTSPLESQPAPRAAGPTGACGRPALAGNIRYLASPQLMVSPNGDIGVVYSYDPDGQDVGDVVDVFFRLSKDQGATWEPEIQLNDDDTDSDQFFPTLSVGPSGRFVAAWYDRRLDDNNIMLDYYARVSSDGGANWLPSERVSDETSPIHIDPSLAACYHGDYDQQLQSESAAYIQWADDRAFRDGFNDPDTYLDKNTLGPDFFLSSDQSIASVCAPDTAQYTINVGQAEGFSSPITLTSSGLPAGAIEGFSTNPVTPDGTSVFTINPGSAAAGNYSVLVQGTDGTNVRGTQISYVLATDSPEMPVQVSPANGATSQSTTPELIWDAVDQAAEYTVQIASDVAFTNIVETGTSTTNSYTVQTPLDTETTYYWVVLGSNFCGGGPNSFISSFTTNATVCSVEGFPIVDLGTTSGSISVTNASIIENLAVSIEANHTWVGDITFTLTNEDTGTSVILMDRPGVPAVSADGCGSDNIDVVFDDDSTIPVEDECSTTPPALGGVLNPDGTLADFDGESFAGTWTLEAVDAFDADPGNVNVWCLIPTLEEVSVDDTDGDGVADDVDNCTAVANPDQRDTNGDGFGNICDPDFDNNGIVNFLDVNAWVPTFNTACGDVDFDLNGDGNCNFADYAIVTSFFLSPPGPGADVPSN